MNVFIFTLTARQQTVRISVMLKQVAHCSNNGSDPIS